MKKYDEMAAEVFRRIEEYNIEKQRKRKRMTRALVPIMCFCLVAVLSVGAWQGGFFEAEPIQSEGDAGQSEVGNGCGDEEVEIDSTRANIGENVPEAEPFIAMCSLQNDGTVKTDLIEPEQVYACRFYINFTPIKGLSEAQIKEKDDELKRSFESILSQNDINGYYYGSSVRREEGYIATRAALNYFTLNLDLDSVEEIKVSSTSEYGQIEVFGTKTQAGQPVPVLHGHALTIGKEQITEDMHFSWNNIVIDEYLKENPNPDCKDFDDCFHFAVKFDDGTVKTAAVSIRFDDSGEATAVCEGYKLLKA